jgi:hypothetical protein
MQFDADIIHYTDNQQYNTAYYSRAAALGAALGQEVLLAF